MLECYDGFRQLAGHYITHTCILFAMKAALALAPMTSSKV